MELIQFFRILIRYWWLILIPTAITAASAVPSLLNRTATAGGYATTITYTAAQDLQAIPNRDGDFQDVWLASELAVNALTDWMRSNSFSAAVSTAAQTDVAFGISTDNQRSVGKIELSAPDADALAAIADATIQTLRENNHEAFPQMGGVPASITVLNSPEVVGTPPPLTNRFAPLIRVALGLFAGVGLAFLAHYLDPKVRQKSDLEALGLPVITSIPRG